MSGGDYVRTPEAHPYLQLKPIQEAKSSHKKNAGLRNNLGSNTVKILLDGYAR